ncbi:hypothetical protein PUN28_002435 [Cardiocondyla obscurior]|uniref:Uncharacterized protein n=1 Tax=Cardiocondyla obscurior TaxID=286306 RepID=A0AAW2GU44_9HYME
MVVVEERISGTDDRTSVAFSKSRSCGDQMLQSCAIPFSKFKEQLDQIITLLRYQRTLTQCHVGSLRKHDS